MRMEIVAKVGKGCSIDGFSNVLQVIKLKDFAYFDFCERFVASRNLLAKAGVFNAIALMLLKADGLKHVVVLVLEVGANLHDERHAQLVRRNLFRLCCVNRLEAALYVSGRQEAEDWVDDNENSERLF